MFMNKLVLGIVFVSAVAQAGTIERKSPEPQLLYGVFEGIFSESCKAFPSSEACAKFSIKDVSLVVESSLPATIDEAYANSIWFAQAGGYSLKIFDYKTSDYPKGTYNFDQISGYMGGDLFLIGKTSFDWEHVALKNYYFGQNGRLYRNPTSREDRTSVVFNVSKTPTPLAMHAAAGLVNKFNFKLEKALEITSALESWVIRMKSTSKVTPSELDQVYTYIAGFELKEFWSLRAVDASDHVAETLRELVKTKQLSEKDAKAFFFYMLKMTSDVFSTLSL
jgi:hypothetical protein